MERKLHNFEALLRQSIHYALANVSDNWWDDHVPPDVKKRADRIYEKRLLRGEQPGSKTECLEFSDYSKIIDANWDSVFGKIFKDMDATCHKFKEMTAIRNKIAHSGAITDNERKGFEYYSEEIRRTLLENGPDHETAASYLERYDHDMRDAYLGAVRAAHQDAYPDQAAQFAHSLREVIDLLARKGQEGIGGDRRRRGGRAEAIQSAVDPHGGSPLGDDYALLDDMYEKLSGIAHHRATITAGEALDILGQACGALLRIARPQLEVEDEAERVIKSGPSEPGARRLVELSGKEVTRTRMAQLLTPEWLPLLIGAGLFGEPPRGAGSGGGGTRIARPLSDYLAKCARRFPDEVSRLVLACPAGSVRSSPWLYPDFLRCAVAFSPDTMEKIAQKALDEGWTDVLISYRPIDLFAAFVEGLLRHKKYLVGTALAYDALKPVPRRIKDDSEPAARLHAKTLDNDLFKSALGEVARRVTRACTEAGIELLARLLEVHAEKEGGAGWAVPGGVASIEASNQNGDGPVNAVVSELRGALERAGGDDPGRLRSIMPALYKKDGMLFRRMELYIYGRFPQAFASETALSLHRYFGAAEAYHEHYCLLRDSFAGMSDQAKESLYALVDRACAGGEGYEPGGDPALAQLAHKKFLFLHAIRDHLDKRHADEYKRLRGAFDEPPHPGYLYYTEIILDGSTASAALPESGDADSAVREAVSSKPPTGPLAEYEDGAADRLEAYVAQDPSGCIPRSAMLKGARPSVQYAFLAGMETALRKKRLAALPDLADLFMHIIGRERDEPGRSGGYGQWDPLLRICWLLETSFKGDAVGPDLAESLEKTILALAEAGARRGPPDCPDDERDAVTSAINSVSGLSFMLLFRYWLWRGGPGDAGKRLDSVLHGIIDGYIDGGAERHTPCRHSAIGLFAVSILQRDPEWLCSIVERIERTKEKASFWAAYVTSNYLYEEMFESIWKHYDMFLNGRRLYELDLGTVVDATFCHVALAYFYGLEHADGIFKRFVREAKPEAIGKTVMPLALIMEGKGGDKRFDLEKAAGLWKMKRFAQLDLGMWFRHTPLSKKMAIDLYRDYLENYRGTFDTLAVPVDELEKYAGEFPSETASCLLHMVEKSSLVDDEAVGRIVGLLEARSGPGIDEACGAIREALAKRGFDPEEDRGMPERRRARHGMRKGNPGTPGARQPAGETGESAPLPRTAKPAAQEIADMPAGRAPPPAQLHPLHKSGMIPSMNGMMYPLLEVCSSGGSWALRSLPGYMSNWLGLSAEQREKRTERGHTSTINDKTRRAAYHLYKAGLLGKERRGGLVYYKTTPSGKEVVADPSISKLTTTYLKENCTPYRKWTEGWPTSRRPPLGGPVAKRSRGT